MRLVLCNYCIQSLIGKHGIERDQDRLPGPTKILNLLLPDLRHPAVLVFRQIVNLRVRHIAVFFDTYFFSTLLSSLWNCSVAGSVLAGMKADASSGVSSARLWILVGAALFLIALTVSAWVVPQLRLLHFLQALIYVAIVILALRNSAWGFGAGVMIAVVWNSLNLFVTHLMQAGAVEFWSFLRTGQIRRPDTMMVPLGGIGHFILIVACLAAVLHQRYEKHKWWKFMAGGVAALAYLVGIVAIARPR